MSVRQMLRRWTGQDMPASCGYQILEQEIPAALTHGWKDQAVAERQHAAFAHLLRQMYAGRPREDFVAVATAIQMTGLDDPLIIEVGCGSGWNSEVLAHLVRPRVRYIGVDYSLAMTTAGKQQYPDGRFVVGDATALPFKDRACEILLSGTVLMHLLGYRQAVRESCRVTKQWCIFHAVPVMQKRSTTILRKFAYGSPVPEIIFNEQELLVLIQGNGMLVRQVLKNFQYDLSRLLGEPTLNRTYVCEIV